MSEALVGFKGLNKNWDKKPVFTVPRAVAQRNAKAARFCGVDGTGLVTAGHGIKSPMVNDVGLWQGDDVREERVQDEETEFVMNASFHL